MMNEKKLKNMMGFFRMDGGVLEFSAGNDPLVAPFDNLRVTGKAY